MEEDLSDQSPLLDSDSEQSSACSYRHDVEFGVGYRFRQEFSSDTDMAAKIVEVLSNGDRLVQYEDSDTKEEKLHVDDIDGLEKLPMFKYSLRGW